MGKVILVTGANKGIGLAVVEALLQEVPESVLLLGSRDQARGQVRDGIGWYSDSEILVIPGRLGWSGGQAG